MLTCINTMTQIEEARNDFSRSHAPIRIVSTLIERLSSQSSVKCVTRFTTHEREEWRRALRTVGHSPMNQNMCTILIEKAFSLLLPSIRRFQAEMEHHDSRSVAELYEKPVQQCIIASLTQLRSDFLALRTLVDEWCVALRMTTAQNELATLLRCTLLQPDLLSGREPAGKSSLVRFLYGYSRGLLVHCANAHSRSSFDEHGLEEGGMSTNILRSTAHRPWVADDEEEEYSSCAPNVAQEIHSCAHEHPGKDGVFAALHGLTLSTAPEIKSLWHSLLQQSIEDKIGDLGDDFDRRSLQECMTWGASVVEPFVRMALNIRPPSNRTVCDANTKTKTGTGAPLRRCDGYDDELFHRQQWCAAHDGTGGNSPAANAALRAEQNEWCARLRQEILLSYARKRLTMFWDLLIEYPDSIPVLEDMHYCLQHCLDDTLKRQLIYSVQRLLVSRLHRAGTRTDDIISVLNKTIHSLCVLLPRSEQSAAILSVISDTLIHLRKRKDCVATIVKSLTQPKVAMTLFGDTHAGYFRLPHAAEAAHRAHTLSGDGLDDCSSMLAHDDDGGEEDNDDEESGDCDNAGWMDYHVDRQHRRMYKGATGSATRAQPDVLRVLLTAVSVKKLDQEYKHVLASQLLTKPLHDFDVAEEEEVLERLKCVLGNDALSSCVIMLHDIQNSRRITQQIRDHVVKLRHARGVDAGGEPTRSVGVDGRDGQAPMLGMASSGPVQQQQQQQLRRRHEDEGVWGPSHRHNSSREGDALHERAEDAESGDEVFEGRGSICLPQSAYAWVPHLSASQTLYADAPGGARSPPPPVPVEDMSVSILSMTAWPREAKLVGGTAAEAGLQAPETYVLHPDLQSEWDRLASAYRSLKANRKLLCMLSQGRVVLELEQRHMITGAKGERHATDSSSTGAMAAVAGLKIISHPTPHTLTLFAASIVLHVRDLVEEQHGQPVPTKLLAQRIGVSVDVLATHIFSLVPAVLVQKADGLVVQSDAITTSNYVFDEAQEGQQDGDDESMQLNEDQIKMIKLMTTAMLKTGGPKSLNDIFNSMKTFVQFQGTVVDMKQLLQTFVTEGALIMKNTNLYAVP